MSVVVRTSDGRIKLMCKGAVSIFSIVRDFPTILKLGPVLLNLGKTIFGLS